MKRIIKIKAIIILMIILFISSLVSVEAQTSNENPQDFSLNLSYNARSYILGPNDVISIYLFDFPEYTQEKIKVQPDGKIIIAPLGPITVSGMTLEELHDILVQKYKTYFTDPLITINLDNTKPFVVYVSGAVLNPGSFEINTDTTRQQSILDNIPEVQVERKSPLLSNVLVAAGGILYDADLEHVQVKNITQKVEFEVNLLELIIKGDANQDIYLMPGDSINVPSLPTPLAVDEKKYKMYSRATFAQNKIPVKVYGYVQRPGLVQLDSKQSANLNSAIVAAGGYLSDSAYAPRAVYLSRVDNNNKLITRKINPMSDEIMLMPNDVIYVPEKVRPLVGKFFDYLTRVIAPANSFANSYNNWALMFHPTRYQIRIGN